MTAHCKRTSHSYFVVMIDHGKIGREAVVNPEHTRRDVVHMLQTGESKHVVFIHHVDGLFVEDVTDELFEEAEQGMPALDRPDRQAARWDHTRDLRKHGAV